MGQIRGSTRASRSRTATGSYGALEDVPLSEARHQFAVNLFGATRLH